MITSETTSPVTTINHSFDLPPLIHSRPDVPHWSYWTLRSSHYLQHSPSKRGITRGGIPGWDTDVWGRGVLSSTLQSYQQVLLCQLCSWSCISVHRPTDTRRKWQESLTAHMEFSSRDNKWLGSVSRPGMRTNYSVVNWKKGTVQFFIGFTFNVFRHKD